MAVSRYVVAISPDRFSTFPWPFQVPAKMDVLNAAFTGVVMIEMMLRRWCQNGGILCSSRILLGILSEDAKTKDNRRTKSEDNTVLRHLKTQNPKSERIGFVEITLTFGIKNSDFRSKNGATLPTNAFLIWTCNMLMPPRPLDSVFSYVTVNVKNLLLCVSRYSSNSRVLYWTLNIFWSTNKPGIPSQNASYDTATTRRGSGEMTHHPTTYGTVVYWSSRLLLLLVDYRY